ncbi:hypothetical protein IQ249_01410 [Lusitaniella coriacea LEGE 07157]|uniref:Uncharacterized protein n=1 Tax=Lusitaniella coriacea LEGE 07157 TaxID=945747 RepID=A0A8J7B2S3_9CYAN|nr:hypothetical protein [Lusitaniella coriacea]MBE9114542.1 hypothetical protein [Lusitaniella coriacea LEGE 07157]
MLKTFSSLVSQTGVAIARKSIKTHRLAISTTLCLSVIGVSSASAISLDFASSGSQGSIIANTAFTANESSNSFETNPVSSLVEPRENQRNEPSHNIAVLPQSPARSLLLNGNHRDNISSATQLSPLLEATKPRQWTPVMDSEMLQLFVASATVLNKLERKHESVEKKGISGITNYYLYRSSKLDNDEEESKKDKR